MRYLGAFCMLASLVYLMWRMGTTRAWIERFPMVLDAALAVGVAAGGLSLLIYENAGAALMQGVEGAFKMGAALIAAHGLAWLVGRVPGCSGVELRIDIPVADRDSALRWLRHRLGREGFRIERVGADADLVAYQGGNPSHWDRRARSKRLWARLDDGPTSDRTTAALKVRYLPPAMGFDRQLRKFLESTLLEEVPSPAARRSRSSRDLFPVEFLVVMGFLVFFALVSFYRW